MEHHTNSYHHALWTTIDLVLLELSLITRTSGTDIKCQLSCSRVRINLSGVEFLADLVVLKSKGIYVILGMDWLGRHNGLMGCAKWYT